MISFILFLGDASDTSITTLNYNITFRDKVVGTLKSTKFKKHGTTYYQSINNTKLRLIKEFLVNYKYDVEFNNGFLNKADVFITVNNSPHSKTSTQWMNSHYKIVKNDATEKTLEDPIYYSTIQLYFNEPINISKCYSEQDGSFNTIVPLENHTYKKINSQGKENIYYYQDGVLTKATIDGGLIHFDIIATKE